MFGRIIQWNHLGLEISNFGAFKFKLNIFTRWASLVGKGKAGNLSAGKESAYDAGDLGSIPRLRRSPGEGKGQYSGLENSLDYIVHGVIKKSDTTEPIFDRYKTIIIYLIWLSFHSL